MEKSTLTTIKYRLYLIIAVISLGIACLGFFFAPCIAPVAEGLQVKESEVIAYYLIAEGLFAGVGTVSLLYWLDRPNR